jgi:hypothetical protein
MSLMAILGSAAGGITGGIGSYLSSRSQEKAVDEQRKLLEDAIAKITQNVGTESAAERDRALVLQRQTQKQSDQLLRRAEQRADADLYSLFASPQYQAMGGYIQDAFTQGIPDVLASEYAGRLRTAQSARGLSFGGAPSQDEAALLTQMAEQSRQALLPQLRQMAFDPLQAGQSARGSRLSELLQSSGQGLQQYQAYQGGLGQAEQIAASRYGTLANTISGLTSQIPVYGGNAIANVLGSMGGLGSSLGSMLQSNSQMAQLAQMLQGRANV